MSAPLSVIVNRGGGTARKLGARLNDVVREAFAGTGADIRLQSVEGEGLTEALRRAVGAPAVVVGGGDGTQSAAAAAFAGSDTALAILPLGTRNHLARQLGIPQDLPRAAAIAVSGRRARIDLARAGDTVFVNNASIGLYTRLVRKREGSRLPKRLATIPAAWAVLREMRLRPLRLDWGEGARDVVTPLLFVGNNRYALEGIGIGKRDALDEGVLSVFAVRYRGRLALALFALRVLVGRADPFRDFAALTETGRLTAEGRGTIEVAHDGEVERMSLPLRFEIMPKALAVMVPGAAS